MRKTNLIYLLVILIIVSCSSDDGSSTSAADSINPPNWIYGVWLQKSGTETTQSGYEFTSDDFLLVLPSIKNSFKENIEQAKKGGAETNVEETITDNEYKIEITIFSATHKYNFKKKSNNIIEWTNDPLGDLAETLYEKQ